MDGCLDGNASTYFFKQLGSKIDLAATSHFSLANGEQINDNNTDFRQCPCALD